MRHAILAVCFSLLTAQVAVAECNCGYPTRCRQPCANCAPRYCIRVPQQIQMCQPKPAEAGSVPPQQGGFAAPPRGGTAQGEANGLGFEGMAIHFPAMTLRMPSVQMPTMHRFRRNAQMSLPETIAPFLENVAKSVEMTGAGAPEAKGLPGGAAPPTAPPSCNVPSCEMPGGAAPCQPVPPPLTTNRLPPTAGHRSPYPQTADAYSLRVIQPSAAELALQEKAAQLAAQQDALLRAQQSLEDKTRLIEQQTAKLQELIAVIEYSQQVQNRSRPEIPAAHLEELSRPAPQFEPSAVQQESADPDPSGTEPRAEAKKAPTLLKTTAAKMTNLFRRQ
jgi:hypothetical protein